MSVDVRDNETGRITSVDELAELHHLIEADQVVPLRGDGTEARVQELYGGYVVDGVPLNVLLGGEWLPDQRELLEPYWISGKVPTPAPQYLEGTPGAEPAQAETPPEKGWFATGPGLLVGVGLLAFWLGRRF